MWYLETPKRKVWLERSHIMFHNEAWPSCWASSQDSSLHRLIVDSMTRSWSWILWYGGAGGGEERRLVWAGERVVGWWVRDVRARLEHWQRVGEWHALTKHDESDTGVTVLREERSLVEWLGDAEAEEWTPTHIVLLIRCWQQNISLLQASDQGTENDRDIDRFRSTGSLVEALSRNLINKVKVDRTVLCALCCNVWDAHNADLSS